ncbi:MAG TPA: hypothetical protein DGP39_03635, partial [Verrucomicrobiales bacterium]|nr:hypothetical protein [Verrucomicrobiales bacterium]
AKANRIKCTNNLKQIYMAHLGFAQDNRERMPWQLTPLGLRRHYGNQLAGPNTPLNAEPSLDILSIWAAPAMKKELQSPKILHSPCDPKAAAGNEIIQNQWRQYNPQGPKLPRQGLSYAIHLGADTQRASSICALTRNFDGDDAPLYQHPGLDLDPIRIPHGRSLRVGSPNAHFIGADRASNSRVMAGLNHGQGQLATMDGSVRQMDETRGRWGSLPEALKAHKATRGGYARGEAYEGITRPRQ